MHILRRIVFYGLLVLIALAPLPFGSNRPWAWSILSLWVGVLVLLDAVAAGFDPVRGESRFMRRIALPFLLFLPVIIWIILQATPNIFTDIAHPIWSEVSAQLGQSLPNYVTISPEMTWDALMVLLAYAGVFWLAARHGRDRKNASLMLKFFVIVSTLYAVYGLWVYFFEWDKVLWYSKTSYHSFLTSTFINKNTYATYAGLGAVSAFILMGTDKELTSWFDNQEKAKDIIFLLEKMFLKWALFCGVIINLSALFLANSRAGLACAGVALVFCLFCMSTGRSFFKKFMVVACVICLFSVMFFVSGSTVSENFARTELDKELRQNLYGDVYEGIETSGDVGYGYGVFEVGFRQFKTTATGWANWSHAHSSYLEWAFGGGYLAFAGVILVFLCLFIVPIYLMKGGVFKSKSCMFLYSSSILVLLHSSVDFSVQIYAVGVTFMMILGAAWSRFVKV